MLAETATATDPMTIRTFHGDAASAARQHGLSDLEQVAVAQLESAPPVHWESTEYAMTVPAKYFGLYLPGFRDAADWRHALMIWLHSGPPDRSLGGQYGVRPSCSARIADPALGQDHAVRRRGPSL